MKCKTGCYLPMIFVFFVSFLYAQDYLVSPQIYNPVGYYKEIQVSYSGEYFGFIDEGITIDLYEKNSIRVLSWSDPEPSIEIEGKNGTKEYLKKINCYKLYPHSKKMLVATSHGDSLVVVDFNGKIQKKVKIAPGIRKIFISPDESRFLIVPYDWQEDYILITDSEFNIVKKIKNIGVIDASFSEDGKSLIIVEDPVESLNGWNATMRLFTSDGEFIKDIENDRPGVIVDTPEGPQTDLKAFPESVSFHPDSKTFFYYGRFGWYSNRDLRVGSVDNKKIFQFPIKNMRSYQKLYFSKEGNIGVLTNETIDFYNNDGIIIDSISLNNPSLDKGSPYSLQLGGFLRSINSAIIYEHNYYHEKNSAEPYRIKIINPKSNIYKINGNSVLKNFTDIRISHDGSEIALERSGGDQPALLLNTITGKVTELEGSVRYDAKGNRANSKWLLTGPQGNQKKSNIMEYTIGNKTFRVAGGGWLLPDHSVAQNPNWWGGTEWTLFDDQGEAVRKVLHDWGFEHGHDFSPDMQNILYKAELRRFSDGKKIGFFFDGHLTGLGRYNPAGTKIMTALATGEINVWGVNGKLEKHLKAHHSMAKGIGMTMDDRVMVSVAEDNKIIIRNFSTDTLATLYFLKPDEYLIITDKGQFDYTGDNAKKIELVSDGEVVTSKYKQARVKNLLKQVINGIK